MRYQAVLPFDENYAWEGLVKQAKELKQGETISFYLPDRKIILRRIIRDIYLITSFSTEALKQLATFESFKAIREVTFMSSVVKPITKHVHYLEKSPTKADDWRKQIYRCKDPHCHHYAQAQFVEGKEVECFKCHALMVVPKAQLWKRNKHIVCVLCSKSPKKETILRSNAAITEILGLSQPKEETTSMIPYSETLEEIRKDNEN